MLTRLALGLALFLPVAETHAQSLLGLDDGSLAATGPVVHEFDFGCTAINRCPTGGTLGPNIAYPAGGVAYDPTDRTTWATNGTVLIQLDERCNVVQRCRIPLPTNLPVTGLAIDWVSRHFYFTDGTDMIYTARVGCPPSPLTRVCQVPSPTVMTVLTGVEWDPWSRSLWVVDALGVVTEVSPASVTGACRVLQQFRIPCPQTNPTRPFQGITVDRCAGRVFITDDTATILSSDLNGMNPRCCSMASTGVRFHFVGLARKPIDTRSYGRGCSGGRCPSCSPNAGTTGDAALPNPNFAVVGTGAPAGGIAYLLVDATPASISFPGLCGPLLVGPAPIVLGPLNVPPAPTPCGGTVSIPVALGPAPALCGVSVYCQWFFLCTFGGQLGHSLSDGIQITFS
ncbi:MAG: hypothetical protein H6834_08800 [Planctomycetes bacterium]|nr:hypothetical protein [Planctomycetota bacterium]